MDRWWKAVVAIRPTTVLWLSLTALTTAVAPARGADLLLRWTASPLADAYHLYSGSQSRVYPERIDVGALSVDTIDGIVFYPIFGLNPERDYFFSVTASNAAGESPYSNEKLITSADGSSPPPLVDAGPDRRGTVGHSFALGTSSVAGLVYAWFQRAGPPATLSARTQSSVTFAPSSPGVYEFVLVAADARGIATSDSVVVNVAPGMSLPPPTPTPVVIGGGPTDTDGDNVIDELDNCPGTANTDQQDTDRDGIGDACDFCEGGFAFGKARVRMFGLDQPPGEQSFLFSGELMVPANFPGIASDTTGARLAIEDLGAVAAPVVLVDVGPGSTPNACGDADGWEVRDVGGRYEFATETDAVTSPAGDFCLGTGSARGVRKLIVARKAAGVRFMARAKFGDFRAVGPLRVTLVLGAGAGSDAALQGNCGTIAFSLDPDDASNCRVSTRNRRVSRMRCSYSNGVRR